MSKERWLPKNKSPENVFPDPDEFKSAYLDEIDLRDQKKPFITCMIEEAQSRMESQLINKVLDQVSGVERRQLAEEADKIERIFHTDHLGKYLLSYEGNTLGMIYIKKQQNVRDSNTMEMVFDPTIRSFD